MSFDFPIAGVARPISLTMFTTSPKASIIPPLLAWSTDPEDPTTTVFTFDSNAPTDAMLQAIESYAHLDTATEAVLNTLRADRQIVKDYLALTAPTTNQNTRFLADVARICRDLIKIQINDLS